MRSMLPRFALLRWCRSQLTFQQVILPVLLFVGVLRSEAVGIVTRRFPAEAIEGQIIEVVLQAEPLVSASAFGVRETLPEGLNTSVQTRLRITPARSVNSDGACFSMVVPVR